jgi:2-amino-4-hydroxy-6-hydroxymethyldihydropteridine diphosphokinase
MAARLAIVGVGSNVDPATHVPAALAALLDAHGALHLSSVVETAPVGMTDGSGAFWNLALAVPTDATAVDLQSTLHALERAAGRDRDAPGQSWKARPLDLDLLFFTTDEPVRSDALPGEPWIRPLVVELLGHLDLDCSAADDPPSGAIALRIGDHPVGPGPATLSLDTP